MKHAAAPVIWAVSDGRSGMVAQAQGLAEHIASLSGGVAVNKIMRAPPYAALPKLPRLKFITDLAALAPGEKKPDIVISCGGRTQTAVLHLKDAFNAFAVCLQRPRFNEKKYDAIVAPFHDYADAEIQRLADRERVILTLGATGTINAAAIQQRRAAATARFKAYPSPRIAVLVGGDNRAYALRPPQLVAQLRNIAEKSGGALLITPSRRTSDAVKTALSEAFAKTHYVWDGAGDNPYADILAAADAVCVTMDSVNMLSEACACQPTVYMLPLTPKKGRRARRGAEKFAEFHRRLSAGGHAREWNGIWQILSPPALLNETARAAAIVWQRAKQAKGE